MEGLHSVEESVNVDEWLAQHWDRRVSYTDQHGVTHDTFTDEEGLVHPATVGLSMEKCGDLRLLREVTPDVLITMLTVSLVSDES
jgi:hypothetical protein